jgi:hypothetical protein
MTHEPHGSSLYSISGLVVWSEMKLPSVISVANKDQSPDIVIRAGHVPAHLPAPLCSTGAWETQEGLFLVRIAGIGSFLILHGSEIVFDLVPGCEHRAAANYLLGACFAALLQQRGNFVLHASAVSACGRAVLFCGQSGAGKSTLAAMLCRRGYALLNDDVCNLVCGTDGAYEVQPHGCKLKLWSESLERLEWNKDPSMAVSANVDKYFLAPPASEIHSLPVGAIYVLREAPPNEANSIRRLRAIEAMNELRCCAYWPAPVTAMDAERACFTASAALQRSVGIYVLSRPIDFGFADALLDLLEEHWNTLPNAANIGQSK